MGASRSTALVTGGNRGLGRETCRQLAARGLDVILTSRNDAGRAVAEALGVGHRRLDVADAESVAELADDLAGRGVRIDALINNAGVALDGFDAEVVRRTLAVNYGGAIAVTDALSPLVPEGGRIVMVSSGVGELAGLDPALRARFADPTLTREGLDALVREFAASVEAGRHRADGWPSSAYRISKVALNAFTRLLHTELEPRGVLVNAVCPGWVRTDMGGPAASRGVEEGAAGIVWAATEVTSSGGFYRDTGSIPW